MVKPVTRGQALQLQARFATDIKYDEVDGDVAQEIIDLPAGDFGERFTAFLNNRARLIVGGSKIIRLGQDDVFDPTFIGQGWEIEEQDERSLVRTALDLDTVRLETCSRGREEWITGEERVKRLKKARRIRLDARFFRKLWENQHLIPESWKEKTNGNTTFIFFDGTILCGPDSNHFSTLCLYWHDGQWRWNCDWLDFARFVKDPSAVLANRFIFRSDLGRGVFVRRLTASPTRRACGPLRRASRIA